ncbi:hypothetical protein [Thiothrix eikelboomii]|uniref:hypothetical protein n=1 Tax=Thiothrix eikelboomii TaxID=92487 RepID=UPI003BAFAA52
MDNRREAEWQKALEQGLNREADELSLAIQARLQQARQQALLELNTQSLAKAKRNWLASLMGRVEAKPSAVLAGLVGAMVLTVGVQVAMNHWADQSLTNAEAMPNNSADVLMSNEDIEFLENMDIYEWLAAEYS